MYAVAKITPKILKKPISVFVLLQNKRGPMSHVTVKYIYPSGKMQHSGCGFTLHINYYGMLQSKLSSFYSNE